MAAGHRGKGRRERAQHVAAQAEGSAARRAPADAATPTRLDTTQTHPNTQRNAPTPQGDQARVLLQQKAAARRGVQVYVVLDAFGSQALSEAVLQELRAEGIWVRKYSPLFRGIRFRIGQRLHHKVIVADQQLALTGGINLADKYCGVGEAAWLDYAVRIRGPLCQDLLRYCTRFWPAAWRLRMPVFSSPDRAGDGVASMRCSGSSVRG